MRQSLTNYDNITIYRWLRETNFDFFSFSRGHKTVEGDRNYSEQSTLRIGESLDHSGKNQGSTSQQQQQQQQQSRHRRHSGNIPENIPGPSSGNPEEIQGTSELQSAGAHRRRSLSDSRSNTRSNGSFESRPSM